jgi:hypothetical protein
MLEIWLAAYRTINKRFEPVYLTRNAACIRGDERRIGSQKES